MHPFVVFLRHKYLSFLCLVGQGGSEQLGGVDTSLSTFINHGCRGSYNVGRQYEYHEMNILDCNHSHQSSTTGNTSQLHQPCMTCDDQDHKVYDPYEERQYPMWGCPYIVANRDIHVGEELFYDYLCMSGTDNMVEEIPHLQSMCSGGIGQVSQYEQEVLATTTVATTTAEDAAVVVED